jgi:hypothetical protein
MINTTRMTVSAGDDPFSLLSAASWMTTFGDDDARQTSESAASFLARTAAKARTSKLKLLCGDTIEFTRGALFSESGFETRTVRFLTMDTPNNYVDGHICTEVKIAGQQVLADVSMNVLFKNSTGVRLSARDAVEAISCNSFSYEMLADDGYAVEPAGAYGFDATGYAESFLLTPQDRRNWHRRVFQAVGIDRFDSDNVMRTYWKLPTGRESRGPWLEGLSPTWKVTDPAVWDSVFYPEI